MSYIVQRNNRSYAVAYNGHDPITGRERRRWHPAGSVRGDAEAVRRRIDRHRPKPACEGSLGGFMSTTWLSTKGTLTHATANRYRWMIDHNVAPRVGTIRLDALRPTTSTPATAISSPTAGAAARAWRPSRCRRSIG
jgi:hypothetical protein